MPPDRVPRALAGGASAADVSPDLAALRRRIAALERRQAALEDAADGSRKGRPWPLGVGAPDGALPEGGLAPNGLHEAAGASAADGPAAEGIPFVASRRLALAAAEGATPTLLLSHDELGPASAALTRWRVTALPGRSDSFDEGARGGRPATCEVEWNRETGDFRVVAALADRPAAPRAGASEVEAPRRARALTGGGG